MNSASEHGQDHAQQYEHEQEADRSWPAEVSVLSRVLGYGCSSADAMEMAEVLALRDDTDHPKMVNSSRSASNFFSCFKHEVWLYAITTKKSMAFYFLHWQVQCQHEFHRAGDQAGCQDYVPGFRDGEEAAPRTPFRAAKPIGLDPADRRSLHWIDRYSHAPEPPRTGFRRSQCPCADR